MGHIREIPGQVLRPSWAPCSLWTPPSSHLHPAWQQGWPRLLGVSKVALTYCPGGTSSTHSDTHLCSIGTQAGMRRWYHQFQSC